MQRETAPPGARQGRVSILLVDDVPANLVALEALLGQPDYRIVQAHSGEEALRRVLDEDFAVILLDVKMPGLDGFEVASLLKRRPRTRHTPIIFVTASGKDEDAVFRGYSVGAVDYLHKPLDPEMVRAKVAGLVELFRRTEQLKLEAERMRARELAGEHRLAALDQARAQRYRNLAEAIPSIVCVAQPNGEVVSVNGRWFDYTGLGEEHARSAGWLAVVHPDDAEACLASWSQAIASGTTVEIECRLRRASDGAYRWHLARAVPDRDTDGTLIAYLAIITDIDDLKRAQREAETERQRAAFLSTASAALASTLDYATALRQVAHLAVPQLGDWCLVDLLGADGTLETLAAAHADPGAERLAAELLRAPDAEDADLRIARPRLTPIRVVGADGELRLAQTERLRRLGARSFIEIPLKARGRPLGSMTFVFTSTERKHSAAEMQLAHELAARAAIAVDNGQLYNEARVAVSTREEFLSIASHELKTPLTSLRLLLQGTLRRLQPQGRGIEPEEIAEQLRKADRQSVRLTQLIDELLDVSRLMAKRLELNPAEVDLVDAVHGVMEDLAPALERSGSRLDVEAEAAVRGNWDRSRLEQVIANLLSNAIKYGGGQPIEITVAHEGERATVSIRDHGIGIAPSHVERIFDPFERAVSHSSYGGLGLGLYISRQIVEMHGGEIHVESAPGCGSRFTVELPLDPSQRKAPAPARPRIQPALARPPQRH